MSKWLIYVRNCPVCQQGLCRVRVCNCNEQIDYFVLCDECDATWLDPKQPTQFKQCDPSDAKCPTCEQSVWSASSHWASLLETIDAGWFGLVYVQPNRELVEKVSLT